MEPQNLGINAGLNPRLGTYFGQGRSIIPLAILTILVVGSLAVGIAGMVQAIQAGVLTNQAIIMGAAGISGSIIFFIIGVIVKNRPTRQIEFIERTAVGHIRDMQRFGKREWETYFGGVREEPPLPDNLDRILNRRCPFAGDARVKIKDTHMLVLVPATVGGETLTLNRLQQLIQNPHNSGNATTCAFHNQSIQPEYGSIETGQSYWVLMTRDVIPGSREKTHHEQIELMPEGYGVPSVREAAICILMEHVISGTRLFETRCHTRCTEVIESELTVTVGGFGSSGLMIDSHHAEHRDVRFGVAARRELD